MSSFYRGHGKRFFDLALGILLLVITFPLAAGAALLIRSRMGGPVFFRQQRPGYEGRPFTLIKFRTMLVPNSDGGPVPADSKRLTKLGKQLRATSIDELPELWNVVKGQMSLVGPRPLLMEYLPRYSDRQARRHEVRPGITGWAQVNGRNLLSWEEKFEMDVWYVDNLSFRLDIRILWGTIASVIRREGISAEGHATQPEFGQDT